MFDEKQKTIKEAIKGKSKTEISIGLRWALNCAVNFVPEKDKGTAKGFRLIEKWYEKFMDLDRNYMLENMPVEQMKLQPKDFAVAKSLSQESEAITSKAEEMADMDKLREDGRDIEEALAIDQDIKIMNENL